AGGAVEADRRAPARAAGRPGDAVGDAAGGEGAVAGGSRRAAVGRGRAGGLLQAVVLHRAGAARRRRARAGPGPDAVLVGHLGGAQHGGKDGGVRHRAGEIPARGGAGPGVDVVVADPPVAGEVLRDLGGGVAGHLDAVDVEGHAHGAGEGRGHQVPAAVVVRGRADDLVRGAAVVDAEGELAAVAHDDLAVVVARQPAVERVAEAHELAAAGRGRAEPDLLGEGLRAGVRAGGPHLAADAVQPDGVVLPRAAARAGDAVGDAGAAVRAGGGAAERAAVGG